MTAGAVVGVEVCSWPAAALNGLEESGWFSQEREALLRIAALAAGGTGQNAVFEAVAAEAAALSDAEVATLVRSDGEHEYTIVGSRAGPVPVGTRIAVGDDEGLIGAIFRIEREARPDRQRDQGELGHLPDAYVGPGGVGVPLTVDDRLWGVLEVTTGSVLRSREAARGLRHFAALVTGAVANAHARAELQSLIDERAFLRRIHAVAGRGGSGADVLAAIAAEGSAWLDGLSTALVRLEDDGTSAVVASSGRDPLVTEPDQRHEDDLVAKVARSAAPCRIDDGGPTNEHRGWASIGVPISVAGRTWGVLSARSPAGAMPPQAEHRLVRFAEAITPTILSAQARTQLAEEQFALRRVAELVARGAGAGEVFELVVVEASGLTRGADVTLARWEDTRRLRVIAAHGANSPAAGALLSADSQVSSVERQSSIVAPIRLGGEQWGLLGATTAAGSFPAGTEHRLNQFADLAAAALANAQARAEIQALADEQAALRRVAELAARDAPIGQVLSAIALEASAVANVEYSGLLRYNVDGSTEIVALHGAPDGFFVGMRAPGDGDGAVLDVLHSGQHARVNDLASVPGSWPDIASRSGFTTGVGVPILIDGALWGALFAAGRLELSASTEEHLTRFAELAGIAMSAAQARHDLRMLADEQVALSRVAALVVRGADLNEVFTAVAAEASGLVDDVAIVLVRLESDSSFVLVAAANSNVPVGFRGQSQQGALLRDLIRTGAPARVESVEDLPWASAARESDVGPTVAVPITVESRLWGALTVSSVHWPLPDDIENRLLKFAELAGAAIANAENKAKLTASRARVVATADETRRRLQRDVHAGAQQRLVHTILTLKLARQSIAAASPPAALVDEALLNAEQASNELGDIVRSILPAALTRGGLRLGLESLLSNLALPVDLHVTAPRCSTDIEQTAYFIVAEALTNVTQHAHADRAAVSVTLDGDTLIIEVSDDGIGGANPVRGTGLIGLADRVDAVEGALTLISPPDGGTTLLARLPVQPLMQSDR